MGILADYNILIKHHSGVKNHADPLSHQPNHDDGSKDNLDITVLPDQLFAQVANVTDLKTAVIHAQ